MNGMTSNDSVAFPGVPLRQALPWLAVGLLIQGSMWVWGEMQGQGHLEAIRYAARYSGRFSFLAFLFSVFCLIQWGGDLQKWRRAFLSSLFFAWVHVLHFGYLATNLAWNEIDPEVPKAIGGALAYVTLVVHPRMLMTRGWRDGVHIWYVYFVGFVMAFTFVARIKGEFPGAPASNFHYCGIVAVMVVLGMFTRKRFFRA
jgi:hypothetical protein